MSQEQVFNVVLAEVTDHLLLYPDGIDDPGMKLVLTGRVAAIQDEVHHPIANHYRVMPVQTDKDLFPGRDMAAYERNQRCQRVPLLRRHAEPGNLRQCQLNGFRLVTQPRVQGFRCIGGEEYQRKGEPERPQYHLATRLQTTVRLVEDDDSQQAAI